ncbi:MAG: exonuclease domain-containing protein [Sutterellaceae bacterium]|nr:exonuclease domain-containing protein [Burkholderiaceae bacterium]MDW8429663.1 exonuclease domain-containing protein [Sutterellaceae bacterium]
MRSRAPLTWIGAGCAAALALLAAAFAVVALALSEEERAALSALLASERAPLLAYGLALLMVITAAVAHWLYRRYPLAARQLAEEARVLLVANPEHSVSTTGAAELRELAAVINQLAARYRQSERELDVRSAEARARVEEERDRFAALMSELSEGVVVCNTDGRVLLYNARAAALLAEGADSRKSNYAPLGLGRSIFGLLDREQVAHALDKIHQQFARGSDRPQTRFIAAAPGGRALRVQVTPYLAGAERQVAGMVFTLDDLSGVLGREDQQLRLLQSLATGARASVANLRAAAESLAAEPRMEEAQRAQFVGIVAQEARALTERLNIALADYADALKGSLTLEDMRVVDLLAIVRRRLQDVLRVVVDLEPPAEDLWVRVDSFGLALALSSLAQRLHTDYGVRRFRLRAHARGRFAEIDLVWLGTMVGSDALMLWEGEPLTSGAEQTPLTLKDVLQRHGGEVWYQADRPRQTAWFRFLLPLGEAPQPTATQRAVPGPRPEYYDFDLFERLDTHGALAERRLSSLTYTVFDTETTGLEPSAGDEIISIGAVRIVNGRLLKHEVFEQLVNPRRPISRESVQVHGIEAAALAHEPTIEEVLPRFHRFCEDTVLVAHNAAFDMRFLQLKESKTGVRFEHPVLDTLLLSAIVHPNQESHALEAIAARLGVRVIGRHTALGDALVTGEVFLRLLPLLAERGIVTLGQALAASRETYLARLQY